MTLTLVADDLSGACDAGALFAGPGPVAVHPDWARLDGARPVVAVDTDSRAAAPDEARRRVAAAARALGPRLRGRLFKKVDSTLRGHVGPELDALLTAAGRRRALLAPAFPAQARAVVAGRLLVGGVPVHDTAIGKDPAFPRPTSAVADLVAAGLAGAVTRLDLETVRRGGAAVRQALAGAAGRLVAADAETDDDLDALAAAADDPEVILAGSAGLARAVARRLALLGEPPPLPEGRAWLVLAGSRHPVTRAQVGALAAAGTDVRAVTPDGPSALGGLARAIGEGRPAVLAAPQAGADDPRARADVAAALARAAVTLLGRCRPDLVVVTGGDTARALARAIGAARIDVIGAPRPGLALGEAARPAGPALWLLTKAGGFGDRDLLLALVKGQP